MFSCARTESTKTNNLRDSISVVHALFGFSLLRQKCYSFMLITDFSSSGVCSSIFGVTVISVIICHFRDIFIFSFTCAIVAVLGIILLLNNFGTFCTHYWFNPLNTKRRLLYLKTQFIPHSKHFSSLL